MPDRSPRCTNSMVSRPAVVPPGPGPLDVTLRRDAQVRRWTINTVDRPDYWSYRFVDGNSVTVSGCFSEAEVSTVMREWKAQIFAAKADGWA